MFALCWRAGQRERGTEGNVNGFHGKDKKATRECTFDQSFRLFRGDFKIKTKVQWLPDLDNSKSLELQTIPGLVEKASRL